VYAHGTANQPWLEVSRAKLNGRVAVITLTVPQVPDRPGETLTAKVTVQSNGNQKFVIPVSLQIGHNLDFAGDAPEPIPILMEEPPKRAVVTAPMINIAPATMPELLPEPVITPRTRGGEGLGAHWLAAVLLGIALLILVILDIFRPAPEEEKERVVTPLKKGNWKDVIAGAKPSLGVGFTDDGRWGLTALDQKDPKNDKKNKRLTFDDRGATNNTVIRVDRYEYVFGRRYGKNSTIYPMKTEITDRYWTKRVVFTEHGVEATQHIILVPGTSGNLDNCLVYYTITNTNKSNVTRSVGVRVLVDTFIGSNDGVPFTIPGRMGFMDTFADIRSKEMPDFIEAVENPDNDKEAGTVARFGLKGIKVPWVEQIDEPTRLIICQQPENPQVKWDWDEFAPISTLRKKDSCVVLYWEDEGLNKGHSRTVGFTYGLNALEITGGTGDEQGSGIALSSPLGAITAKEFTVTAYVYNAKAGQKVTLDLPGGLEFAGSDDGKATKTVDEAGKRQAVHWKVRGTKLGPHKIKAKSGSTESRPKTIRIRDDSIFG
jgi:hypothetical protein